MNFETYACLHVLPQLLPIGDSRLFIVRKPWFNHVCHLSCPFGHLIIRPFRSVLGVCSSCVVLSIFVVPLHRRCAPSCYHAALTFAVFPRHQLSFQAVTSLVRLPYALSQMSLVSPVDLMFHNKKIGNFVSATHVSSSVRKRTPLTAFYFNLHTISICRAHGAAHTPRKTCQLFYPIGSLTFSAISTWRPFRYVALFAQSFVSSFFLSA